MLYAIDMDDEKFEQLVAEGLEKIEKRFLDKLDNVAIVIADEPTLEQRRELKLHDHASLFGLYQGIPLTKRDSGYSGVLPDKITIFKKPILAAAGSKEEIREMVAETVWHEIGHHFGLDESEVRRREAKRRKRKNH